MQCTNRLFYIRRYQCVKRRSSDSVDATKSLFSWCNRIDFSNDHRSWSRKIVCTRYFSENSLHSRCAECNVHINYCICVNINALNAVALILLTWRNCSSHRIIDLMLQEFNVYINAKRLHQCLHYIQKLESSILYTLYYVLDFEEASFRSSAYFIIYVFVCILSELIAESAAMISISSISHRSAYVIKAQISLITSKIW